MTAESGVHELDHFQIVRLDVRPACTYRTPTAKILCTLELSNGQAGASGMCCSFAVDLDSGNLTENVR